MRNCDLDERQLWLRGEAFKHGFVLMGALVLIDAFLKSDIITPTGITLVEGMWGNILIIVLTTGFCMLEMILRGAMDLEVGANYRMILFLGIVGGVLIIWGLVDVFIKHEVLFTQTSLSERGAQFLMDFMWFSVGITGIIKKRKIKYEE